MGEGIERRRNRWASTCAGCGGRVAPRDGYVESQRGLVKVIHEDCRPPVFGTAPRPRPRARLEPLALARTRRVGESLVMHRRGMVLGALAVLAAGLAAVLAGGSVSDGSAGDEAFTIVDFEPPVDVDAIVVETTAAPPPTTETPTTVAVPPPPVEVAAAVVTSPPRPARTMAPPETAPPEPIVAVEAPSPTEAPPTTLAPVAEVPDTVAPETTAPAGEQTTSTTAPRDRADRRDRACDDDRRARCRNNDDKDRRDEGRRGHDRGDVDD